MRTHRSPSIRLEFAHLVRGARRLLWALVPAALWLVPAGSHAAVDSFELAGDLRQQLVGYFTMAAEHLVNV